jgi:F-type H+-transporting ATPase subunit c
MLLNFLADAATTAVGPSKYLAIAIVSLALCFVGFGEAIVAYAGVAGTAKNPEAASKLRTNMIVGIALVETEAIYSLVVMILLIFSA